MPKGVLSQLTIWTLILGGCVAVGATGSGATAAPAAQAPAAQPLPGPTQTATPEPPAKTMALAPLPGVVEQMLALEHNARVGMLCYTGRLGEARHAAAPKRLDPVAFHIASRK